MPGHAPIRPLTDVVINQIAAGEVIERPASIVKELCENSLDAGATQISIELAEAGIKKILIRDNGRGIPAEQLPLALLRHHTSKLIDAEELVSIRTLGFRGEALASIAAVAVCRITSRTAADAHGWCINVGPGKPPGRPVPQAHPPGTTIEVLDLFATLPARREFLKRPRTEFLHIQQLVRRAGFCYPEVALRLFADGRQNLALTAPREDTANDRRWRSLFGREFMAESRRIDVCADGVRVHGWVGQSDFTRQTSDLQFIAVNRRIVHDRNIAHAIRMAYNSPADDGRHIAYAIHVDLPCEAVDVNVHPGKSEVRFRDPRAIHDIVYAAVKQALESSPAVRTDFEYAAQTSAPVFAIADGRTRSFPRPTLTSAIRVRDTGASVDSGELLAITHDRYAFIVLADTVRALDVHAAIRSIVAARLRCGECNSRPLIIPEAVAGALDDAAIDELTALGVEFGRLGDNRLALRAISVVVGDVDVKMFAASLLHALMRGLERCDAISTAAAAAFRTPSSRAERDRWFASFSRRLLEIGIADETFGVTFDRATLSGLLPNTEP